MSKKWMSLFVSEPACGGWGWLGWHGKIYE